MFNAKYSIKENEIMANKTIIATLLISISAIVISVLAFIGLLEYISYKHTQYDLYGGITKTKYGYHATKSYAKWPDDMPTEVPKFNYGTISQSSKDKYTNDKTIWGVIYDQVSENDIDKYKQELKNNGWKVERDKDFAENNETYLFTAEKGSLILRINIWKDPYLNMIGITVINNTVKK
jgi:hypothetical protein